MGRVLAGCGWVSSGRDWSSRALRRSSMIAKLRQPPRHLFARGTRALGALLTTAIAIIGAAAVLWPKLTVELEGTGSATTSDLAFRIRNTGFIPLIELSPMFGLCDFMPAGSPGPAQTCGNGPLKTRLMPTPWHARRLEMDEAFTLRLDDALRFPPQKLVHGDVSVIVQYQPWFIPIRMEKEFRFVTTADAAGIVTWRTRPVEK